MAFMVSLRSRARSRRRKLATEDELGYNGRAEQLEDGRWVMR
jgi:hypothetical protein